MTTRKSFLTACLALLAAPFLRRKKPVEIRDMEALPQHSPVLGYKRVSYDGGLTWTETFRHPDYITLYPSDRA